MISIVIPTYNRSNLLLETVKSILKQTYKDFELIVVSDGDCYLVENPQRPLSG